MEEIVKHINDTNASYRKLNAGDAKNTDLFLDNEHYELFRDVGEQITVRLSKENLTKAILFIASILPRKYDNSAIHRTIPFSKRFVLEQLELLDGYFVVDGVNVDYKTQIWNARKDVPQKNGKIDNRFYFNGLLDDFSYKDTNGLFQRAKFTIRNYLAGGYSDIHIRKSDDGIFDVWVTNTLEPYNDGKDCLESTKEIADNCLFRPYITAIKSKPFLLLAGISGTGKSRIVRELARACWDEGSTEFKAQKPKNFEMVQVKPNWHDSSELIGYVSRIDGVRYVVGPFLKFMVKAINDPDTPYFLCLDEMNLAPVEQYFAEFLSVVESRKRQEDGTITTDPIVEYSNTDEYKSLIDQLFPNDDTLRSQYLTEKGGKRLSIPTNLIVVGTVNMDETTFSFSRKVLDRAMTIEMNEVDLYGGLDDRHEKIGKLEAGNLIGTAVEGVDVYRENKEVCDTALKYLQAINLNLEGTPFKVAYRTRNEFLLYVVNNLPYSKDKEGNEIPQQEVIARALDEITSMKILSRIEGDSDKIGNLLEELEKTISEQLKVISGKDYSEKKNDGEKVYSVSLAKLKEMEDRLKSGYTSFWS